MFRRRVITRSSETRSLPLPGKSEIPDSESRFHYQLKRSSARRTLALRITAEGEITVNAPLRLSQAHIESFLREHADWLRERLEKHKTNTFSWANGITLPWLGSTLELHWNPGHADKPRIQGGQLHLGGDWARVQTDVVLAYQQAALPYFKTRLAEHARRMGVAPPTLRLSNARTRWGSLSPKGGISLNWRLIKAPPAIIDYVICHELAHLRQRNHSPAFWREVATLFPNYAEARKHLKTQGAVYFHF